MRILLVEDDGSLRELIKALLVDDGNIVHSADSVELALDIVKGNPAPDLLVTDFNLGHATNGVDLAEKLQHLCLAVPVLVVSGRPDLVQAEITRLPGARFLAKPFTGDDLLAAVRQATAT